MLARDPRAPCTGNRESTQAFEARSDKEVSDGAGSFPTEREE